RGGTLSARTPPVASAPGSPWPLDRMECRRAGTESVYLLAISLFHSSIFMKIELVTVRCKCGLTAQIPAGGKRLCACGKWLTAEEVVADAEPVDAAPAGGLGWPRIEGDLS